MITSTTAAVRATLLALAAARLTLAQNCYFPNGGVAPDSSPCFPSSSTSGASVCCPLNWSCESNGLCYLDAEDYYGRYSCTDQSWSDSACPDYCTQNGTAIGNEAILQCSDGSWCCDGNRSTDCCSDSSAEVIDVPDGSSVAFISQTPSPSSVSSMPAAATTSSAAADSSSSSSSPSASSTSSTPTSTSASSPGSSSTFSISSTYQTPTPQPTTITTQAATTNSQGIATTVLIVSTAIYTPPPSNATSSTPSAQPSNEKPTNTTLIAGLAAGIPTALLFTAALILLFRRRKRQTQQNDQDPKPSTSESSGGSSDLKYMYTNTTPDGSPPEIDSYPVAAGTKPGHKSYSQVSELSGSEPTYQQKSPAVSSLSSPYSPQQPGGGGSAPFGGGLGQVQEEQKQNMQDGGPVELPAESAAVHALDWAKRERTSYPGYQPYPSGQAEGGSASQPGNGSEYVAYRPPTVEEDNSTAAAASASQETSTHPAERREVDQVSSAQSDFDHGQLGAGGLRIVNQ